jgi:hypothetical protein
MLSPRAWAGREQEVKAAIIYNIAKFVEWPQGSLPNPDEPIMLGVAESDPMADGLEILNGKALRGRRLFIKRIIHWDEFKKCQIVFFGPSSRKTAGSILTNLSGLPILTITDERENFAQGGSLINLVSETGKIRFQVNLAAVRRSGLRISSQLLKLAEIIDGDEK